MSDPKTPKELPGLPDAPNLPDNIPNVPDLPDAPNAPDLPDDTAEMLYLSTVKKVERVSKYRKTIRAVAGTFPLFLIPLLLMRCAIVNVQTPDGAVKTSVYPLGVKIEASDKQATAIDAKVIGMAAGCFAAGFGFVRMSCDVINPSTCGAAIVRPNASQSIVPWGDISMKTEAHCAGKE